MLPPSATWLSASAPPRSGPERRELEGGAPEPRENSPDPLRPEKEPGGITLPSQADLAGLSAGTRAWEKNERNSPQGVFFVQDGTEWGSLSKNGDRAGEILDDEKEILPSRTALK
ncbi:hypothetical protein TthTF19_21110 (plasmid) [Thermus thermophilus]|uniref:Uncharacterized protein n=1 Tax=Thermus thermophilus TaxID=274 RepID=A0AAD1KWL6_THETH|nr:hypothetical protein TthAA11_21840 [Thermus thermophilus]